MFKNLRIRHHKGVVGIDDLKTAHPWKASPVNRHDSVVFTLEQETKNRNCPPSAHDDIHSMFTGKLRHLFPHALRRKAPPSWPQKTPAQRGILQPIDNFAPLVGRSQHDDSSRNPIRSPGSQTTQDNPTHRMSDEMSSLVGRRNTFCNLLDNLRERFAKGRVGNTQSLETRFIQMPGRSLHGPDTSPQTV